MKKAAAKTGKPAKADAKTAKPAKAVKPVKKAVKHVKAITNSKQPGGIKRKLGAPGKKAARLVLPFPGVPTKPKEPMSFNNFRVYSDLKSHKWRVCAVGARKDVSASWMTDPKLAWAKVNQVFNRHHQSSPKLICVNLLILLLSWLRVLGTHLLLAVVLGPRPNAMKAPQCSTTVFVSQQVAFNAGFPASQKEFPALRSVKKLALYKA